MGVREGRLGGGGPVGVIWGVHAPQGQVLVNHRLPLPPLATPLSLCAPLDLPLCALPILPFVLP